VNEKLQRESELLTRSWMRHEPAWLRDYLVASVEDPRLNLQSILTRHFLLTSLSGARYAELMEAEYRFAAAMNWFLSLSKKKPVAEDYEAILHALRKRADNAEGIEVPEYMSQIFAGLPARAGELMVPNYIETWLTSEGPERESLVGEGGCLNMFMELWRMALAADSRLLGQGGRLRVIEPACGSANDYRFFDACGLAGFLDYFGFDLCPSNVENARKLFPEVRFETGNAFELAAQDKEFDLCVVHDLFEHLSPEGLEAAIAELCRVTKQGICAGFFSMDEIPEPVVRQVEDYHWNTLSMSKTREAFARHGFAAQVVHVGSFLKQQVGCDQTHNPNAFTFVLRAT